MQPVSFKRHRLPPDVIRRAVWLYFRFTLSSARRFLANRAAVYNTFNIQRYLIRQPMLRLFRAEADCTWAAATAVA
jgi:putative transposase